MTNGSLMKVQRIAGPALSDKWVEKQFSVYESGRFIQVLLYMLFIIMITIEY